VSGHFDGNEYEHPQIVDLSARSKSDRPIEGV
jgi:hypothetical protein